MAGIHIAILFVCAAWQISLGAAWPGTEFASEDRQFFVELSRTPEDEVLVAVHQSTNKVKELRWSRKVKIERKHSWPSPQVDDVKPLITNDGNTVVLRTTDTTAETNAIYIVRRPVPDVHTIDPFGRHELTGTTNSQVNVGMMRMGTSYLHVSCLLDLMVEEMNSYALWFGQTDKWLLISLDDFKTSVVTDPKVMVTVNKLAQVKARELALLHQPPRLRRILSRLQNSIAEYIPSLGTASTRPHMHRDVIGAYMFLAARRQSSDLPLIEGLVNHHTDGLQRAHGHIDDNFVVNLNISHPERLVGDFLLGQWQGETNREFRLMPTYYLLPQDTHRYLGSAKFKVEFPVPVQSTNTSYLWAYFIPADIAATKWEESDELIAFTVPLQTFSGRTSSELLGSEARVNVYGLSPGDYRAKFVWERARPAGVWRTNVYLGTVGDFESGQSPVINVKAGEIIKEVAVGVTNRVGQVPVQGN